MHHLKRIRAEDRGRVHLVDLLTFTSLSHFTNFLSPPRKRSKRSAHNAPLTPSLTSNIFITLL